MTSIGALFHQCFEVLTDYTDRVYDASLRLRYQVYCLETGFENRHDFVDGRERDTFDRHAVHGLVRHRETGVELATVRLVRAIDADPESLLPIQHSHPRLFAAHGIDRRVLPPYETAEISRFAVSKTFQHYLGTTFARREFFETAGPLYHRSRAHFKSRRWPLATFGLFLALVRLSAQHGIRHWVAVMEPALLRLLARFGIRFTRIGGLVNHHGWRQPCFGPVQDVLSGIHDENFDLWRLITDNGTGHPSRRLAVGTSKPRGVSRECVYNRSLRVARFAEHNGLSRPATIAGQPARRL